MTAPALLAALAESERRVDVWVEEAKRALDRAEKAEAQVQAMRAAFENRPLILSAILRDLDRTPNGRGGEVHFHPATPGHGKSGCPGDNVTVWLDEIRAALDTGSGS